MRNDLTISESLRDPLIAIMMRADGVKLEELKQLLETAAHERESKLGSSINGGAKERATRMPAPLHQREDI